MTGEIWKRQDCDTNKSFQAFCIYRNLGKDRTLEEVTKQFYYNVKGGSEVGALKSFKSKLNQVRKWSAENKWVERVGAYDDYLDEQCRRDIETERREAIEMQKKIARVALQKAFEHIDSLDPVESKTRDMTALLKEAANIQRLCFGEATELVKSENTNEDIVIMIPDNGRE